MASSTTKAFLILGRINSSRSSLQHGTNRATYVTVLSINSPTPNKGLPERGGRGQFVRKPRREIGLLCTFCCSFKPNAIPLPIRMGYPIKGGILSVQSGPPLWTQMLNVTSTSCKVQTTDYVSAGPSLRNPSARIVHLKVKLSSLNLDDHARKKMIKLVGSRYCKNTDLLTITTDSCPLRKQNYDYAMYLLTVLYHESWKTENWEAEKTAADMEEYSWENSPSQRNLLDTLTRMKVEEEGAEEEVRQQLLGRPEVQEYKDSVTRLKNEGKMKTLCYIFGINISQNSPRCIKTDVSLMD
ncbi:hypothetical protein WMY93_023378 [Mugilogobius chulae]|uniref:Small ribosomal subunit protein mS35 mitochondrial conserved domain-containing protein n=1 Tax=Mugilogobius chulae TaxID=88201 RepID=A0AAW0NE17_9GOBI